MGGLTHLIADARAPEHDVEIYRELGELAESVAGFLADGFEVGAPAAVVARPRSWEAFAAALSRQGWDASRAEAEGSLVVADAGTTLASFMDGPALSAKRFEQVVGGLLDRVQRPDARTRVYGEMVDLLCRRGQPETAAELEAFWNELGRKRTFSLLCAYRLDVFDPEAQLTALPTVCHLHSHVKPAADPIRLAHAVDRALEEVLGRVEAGKIYDAVGRDSENKRIPVPQVILMWVCAYLPALADRVLAAARAHYEQPAAA